MLNYISNFLIPFIILLIVLTGFIERKNTFDIFLNGAKEGIEIVVNIFPTLLGLFMAISLLRASGVIDFFVQVISPILSIFHIPGEIIPLAILRPVSR